MCPTTTDPPQPCPAGYYSYRNATSCTICPEGHACYNKTNPLPCPLGWYSTAGDEVCHPCPAGYACSSPNALGALCGPGTFACAGSTNCTNCPAGMACPDTKTPDSNYPCPPGTYRIVGQTSTCTTCTAGYMCPYTDVDLEMPCGYGHYSLPGQTNCTICPPGYACTDQIGTMQPCKVCACDRLLATMQGGPLDKMPSLFRDLGHLMRTKGKCSET